tara:strand:+ start:1658 stop:2155 length:498 start_codon:yes stop_codon:yes gene_type:complete
MRESIEEVETVLNEFFQFEEGTGWINPRADEEILKYQGKLETASRAGKASAQARMNKSSTPVQLNKKQETIPVTNKQIKIQKPDLVSEEVWDDFVKHRRNVKAPLTETALKGITKEASKAGVTLESVLTLCQVRGWRGFKAEWIEKTKGERDYKETTYHEGVEEI